MPDQIPSHTMPRWVKISGAALLALLLLFGGLHLFGMRSFGHNFMGHGAHPSTTADQDERKP